jgi:hypothetical protein
MPEQLSSETLPLSKRTHSYWPQGRSTILEASHFSGVANPNVDLVGQRAQTGNYYVSDQLQKARETNRGPSFRGRITAPVQTLLALINRWQLDNQDAAKLLGASDAQFVIDLRVGTVGLSTKDMQDRVRLLLRIYEGVHSLLRQPEAERSWINVPIPALGNQAILETMLRGSMADLACVRAFVEHANGR